jgi:hypothetical protein
MAKPVVAVNIRNILGDDMGGKQQQNNADDYNPKNNMLYFFHEVQPLDFFKDKN